MRLLTTAILHDQFVPGRLQTFSWLVHNSLWPIQMSFIKTPQLAAEACFKAVLSFDSQDLGGHIGPGTTVRVADHPDLVQHLVARGFLRPTLPHANEVDWTGLVDRARALQHAAVQELLRPISTEGDAGVSLATTTAQGCGQNGNPSEPTPSSETMLSEEPATEPESDSVPLMRIDHIRSAGPGSYLAARHNCASHEPGIEAEAVQSEEPMVQEVITEGTGSQPCFVGGSTFDLLIKSLEELELQMALSAERAKADAGISREVKNMVLEIKAHAERNYRELKRTKSRVAAAEGRAAIAEARAAALQEAFDAAAGQSVAAENMVSQFEQAISTFRKSREAQESPATCRKCGRAAEVNNFPGDGRSVTLTASALEASCAILDSVPIVIRA